MLEDRAKTAKVVLIIVMIALVTYLGLMVYQVISYNNYPDIFEHIRYTTKGEIVYDKETGVMYLVNERYGRYGNRTVTRLVNEDGTPRMWEGSEIDVGEEDKE